MNENENENRRILLVDDTDAIHGDFRKVLRDGPPDASGGFADERAAFFGEEEQAIQARGFQVDSAHQGREALEMVQAACERGEPYAMAFVDVRMPPGWDGVETIERLWVADPDLQVVICTAFSDYSWDQIVERLGATDQLLILKKPFDAIEVSQMANALTEKWNAEQSRRRTLRELEQAEREARERAQELKTANEAAEAASRAKSEFLANMSHEIRTPMTAILGHAEMLRDRTLDQRARLEQLDIIRNSGRHLLTILEDILDLSKVEAGRLAIAPKRFPLLTLVRDVVDLMRVQAREKGLALDLELGTPVPAEIKSDPVRVRQVLLNLLGNAVKFTDEGSIRVVLRVPDDEPREAIEIDVVDTGVGIALENLERLFEPFHQVDNSLTREAGGTGIGLTISRQLAGLLGGDIRVRSKAGGGSTFTARIATGSQAGVPLVEHLDDAAPPAPPPPDARELPGLRGRVLLAEDTPLNQKLVATYLKKAGADVVLADDGRQASDLALEALRAGREFDLILMDMQMPVMDGYEAARLLRREGYVGPIVALTAHAMQGDREKCLASGCDDYTVKPVERARLIELCHERMQPRGPLPGSPAPEPASSEERPRRDRG